MVFITERDVVGRGEAVYRFDRCDLRTGESFGDGSHIVYVNGAYRDQSPVGRLMHDFFCTDPEQMYYETLAKRTKYFKEGEGVPEMCREYEQLLEEGQAKEKRSVVRKMLAAGKLALEEIVEYSGLPLDEVQRIAAEMGR